MLRKFLIQKLLVMNFEDTDVSNDFQITFQQDTSKALHISSKALQKLFEISGVELEFLMDEIRFILDRTKVNFLSFHH